MYFSFRCGKGFIPLVRFWWIIPFYWNNADFAVERYFNAHVDTGVFCPFHGACYVALFETSRASTHLSACPKSRSAGRVRVSELVSEWVSNCSQGVALNGFLTLLCASERALKERCSERAACDGHVRLLNRQLSLPVSMIAMKRQAVE
jgi:hypothetical protein